MPEGVTSIVSRGPVLDDGRETIGTSPLDADPVAVLHMPPDSSWPVLLALALTVVFYALLAVSWRWTGVGALLVFICLVGWLTPSRSARGAGED
jgi:cytochrome c oxidase subunit 1/cytochrome c oxidase subunit I+III